MKNLKSLLKPKVLFLSSVVLFLIIKLSQLSYKFSDGFTYMYMGNLVLEGLVPYKDFFLANPPLQIYLMALVQTLIGENFLLLKLIPLFATIGSSFFIYGFMKRKFGDFQALTASILFLFSFLILLTTDYSTGIHLTLFFTLGAIYFTGEERAFFSGVFGSLALLTRIYAIFPLTGIGIYYLIYRREKFLSFSAGTLSIFFPVSLVFQIMSHGAYLDQIFFFRLNLVSGIGLSKLKIITFFILRDLTLVLGTLLYLMFCKKRREMLIILATGLSLILYTIYSDIYYLYFGLIIGFLAIFTTRFFFLFKELCHFKKILAIFLILLVLINSYFYIENYGSNSEIVFTEDLVQFVKENSYENQTIYGSFEIAPLISLLSNRRLAGNLADTNPKNVMTSTLTIKDLEEKISGVKFIIVKANVLPGGGITGFDASTPSEYINAHCIVSKVYSVEKDYSNNAVIIFDCGETKTSTQT
ncbi:MAG: glycosyltransferase family 39 protein [Nanoarchaeota archaeon]|nr:glycosyltransferase family 39 protein [Nanoarchaeota archaeon]